MIIRLYRSRSDIENLSKLKVTPQASVDDFDYKRIIVNKPWGYEYLMYENKEVAIWTLYLKPEHKTSMHCHFYKKTSLIVISGEVICTSLEGWFKLKQGDVLNIDETVFHSTRAISGNGAIVLEMEKPPNKRDLIRLKDEYGRVLQGYEGIEKMSKDYFRYEYVDFHNYSKRKITKRLRDCRLTLSPFTNNKHLTQILKKENAHLLCVLQGNLHDKSGKIILTAGDTSLLSEICIYPMITTFSDLTYLTIYPNFISNLNSL